MSRRYRIVWPAIVGTVLLAACGGANRDSGGGRGGGGGHGSPAQAHVTSAARAADHDAKRLACHESIGLDRPGANHLHVVLGVVALPAAPGYGALQTTRTGMHGRLRLFAKTGLLVKPRTSFRLVVPAGLRGRMALDWGNAGEGAPSSRFIVDGCGRGETTGSRWLAYAGGYYVAHPMCASLVVVAKDRRRRVRIGLGAPCAGQRPPPQPTQS